MTNRVGQQLGNYRLIRLLGQGGFADTYLGEHTYLKTFAAIKVLHAQLSQGDQQAFYTEARTIAHLKHPNIVRVLEFGVESYTNTPYLVMDYAPNGTLRQCHRRGIALPVSVIVPYVKQVAAGLQHAHDQKLVHRDVKPENMLLGPTNEVLLSDFGIAIIAQSTRTPSPQDVAGTVTYMAPEQIQGKPRPASDQYALAVVVYEWLCGAAPFSGTYIEVAIQHERVAPSLLREKEPTVPPDVEQVVLTALSKEPQRRFGSVQAFANALEQASKAAPAHFPHSSSDDSQLYKSTEMMSRNPGSPPFPVEQVLPSQTAYGVQAAYTPAQTPAASQHPYTPQQTPAGGPNPYTPQRTPAASQHPYTPLPTPPGLQAPVIAQQAAPQGPYSPPQAPRPPRPLIPLPPVMTILLVVLALLLIGGSGLISYTTVFRPNQLHAQATASAQAQIMGTANANATGTAQAIATTQAQTNATATAQAQATANAQATATALQGIYTQATSGTPAINDPLSGGDSFGWDQFTGNPGGGCSFQGGAYHSSSPAGYITPCAATATNFSSFALQVQMTVISGHSGGLIFRCDSPEHNFYAFRISTTGDYLFQRISPDTAGHINPTTLTSGSSPAINTGNNASNLIAVVAQGNTFYLYVNKQYVDSASDSTYKSGAIGVYTDSDTSSVEAAFSHLEVWKL